jgi:hypothetical protein
MCKLKVILLLLGRVSGGPVELPPSDLLLSLDGGRELGRVHVRLVIELCERQANSQVSGYPSNPTGPGSSPSTEGTREGERVETEKRTVDRDKLGCAVLHRLVTVSRLERIIDLVPMRPPPSLDPTELLAIPFNLSIIRNRQHELRRILRLGVRARRVNRLARPSIESLETDDEGSFARGTVRAEPGVLVVGEEGDVGDVVCGRPSWGEGVGRAVAGAGAELRDAGRAKKVSGVRERKRKGREGTSPCATGHARCRTSLEGQRN